MENEICGNLQLVTFWKNKSVNVPEQETDKRKTLGPVSHEEKKYGPFSSDF